MKSYLLFAATILVFSASGCSQSSSEATTSQAGTAMPDASRYRLSHEPAGAMDVIAARQAAKDKQEIVVVGRIGGGINPWIEGRAAFLLVDATAASSCEEDGCDEGCTCHAEELAEATTLIKFVDENGSTLPFDARQLLNLEEKQTVVVRGIAKRGPDDNLSVVASGIYVRR